VDLVRKILNESVKYRNVQANFSILFAACADIDLSPAVVRAAPIGTAAEVRGVIERIAHRLGVNSEYANAFAGLWEARPELKLECNEHLLAELADEEINADHLIYLASQDDVAARLATTIAFQREQQEADAALAEIRTQEKEASEIRAELLGWFETARKHLLKGAHAHPSVWKNELARETARLDGMGLDQLREEIAARREKKRLAGLGKEELRAELRKESTQRGQQLYENQFPQLPKIWYPRGNFQGIELTARLLKQLARDDFETFKYLCRVYSEKAVTERMNSPE